MPAACTQVDTGGVLRALLALRVKYDPLFKLDRGRFAIADH
jgi:hypothetical protein